MAVSCASTSPSHLLMIHSSTRKLSPKPGQKMCIRDRGYIANLAVAPAFRRQGVARALLRAGAEIAEKEKLEFLSLEVRTSNLPARRLYESEGYVHIGARPGFYTNPREDGEIYTKRFGGSL